MVTLTMLAASARGPMSGGVMPQATSTVSQGDERSNPVALRLLLSQTMLFTSFENTYTERRTF